MFCFIISVYIEDGCKDRAKCGVQGGLRNVEMYIKIAK